MSTTTQRAQESVSVKPFLTARWLNLGLFNYPVPDDVLLPLLPPGLELDRFEGSAYVSLVAFQFADTKVWGIPWPGYRNFAELNLRFYVRSADRRGVVFVREYVPKRLIAWIARWVYNEPYLAAPLEYILDETTEKVTGTCRLHVGGRWHFLQVTGAKPARPTPTESLEHFFKEHEWGFGKDRGGGLRRYRVHHPIWHVYPVIRYEVNLDWKTVYGPSWAFLNQVRPASVVFAVGSEVVVYPQDRDLYAKETLVGQTRME